MLRLLVVALWGMSFIVGSAVAAGLPTATASLGSGSASVVGCDTDGIGLTYQLGASENLVSVTLTNVSTGCAGGAARVTLTNGSAVVGNGTANIPAGGFSGEVVVQLAAPVSPADVQVTLVAIDGV